MKTYRGKSVFGGIAVGNIKLLQPKPQQVEKEQVQDPLGEKLRFEKARMQTQAKLRELYHKTSEHLGETGAAIFEMQSTLLDDPDYLNYIYHLLEQQQVTCEYAIFQSGEYFAKLFRKMESAYMRERGSDFRNVAALLMDALKGAWDEHRYALSQPAIVVAHDLSPSEATLLDKDKVLAFVIAQGSVHSHTAILARMMGIPALVGTNFDLGQVSDGALAIADAGQGLFIVEPDSQTIRRYQKMARQQQAKVQGLQSFKGKKTVTLDGKTIQLFANIGSLPDLEAAIQNDAEGIGLFRSECLYLGKSSPPSEEEQFEVYARVAQAMQGKKVIIRTLDLGGDKQTAYLGMEQEKNPSMGYRGIRICLDKTEMFQTQLRALLRASAYGNIAVLYPMIVSADEVDKALNLFEQVREDLNQQGVPLGRVEQGIMIETPAAALISDLLAHKVDFFSIGTNDLIQYTLAADRQNPRVESLYDPTHPAVLRLMQMVVSHGHRAGKKVSICGEAAADLSLIPTWIDLGIDMLSVPPPCILPVRKVISNLKSNENSPQTIMP